MTLIKWKTMILYVYLILSLPMWERVRHYGSDKEVDFLVAPLPRHLASIGGYSLTMDCRVALLLAMTQRNLDE